MARHPIDRWFRWPPSIKTFLQSCTLCACVRARAYPRTAAEAARVQEGEQVDAQRSGQYAGEVCGLQGEPSAYAVAQERELPRGTAEHQILQHHPPLGVRPPVELTAGATFLVRVA